MRIRNVAIIAGVLAGTLGAGVARAQFVEIQNSPDTPPAGVADMNLETLLRRIGIGSYLYADPARNGGNPTDQILERAFLANPSSPLSFEVLFDDAVRTSASAYQPFHRIGWYQGPGTPSEAAIRDVLFEAMAQDSGGSAKLTTQAGDFAGLDPSQAFWLRLTSATASDLRGGSIFSNDALNEAGFPNIALFQERDAAGVLIPNSYIVAWEDLRGGGDRDYQDMVVRVSGVQAISANNIPEPASLGLLTLGLAGLLRRRR